MRLRLLVLQVCLQLAMVTLVTDCNSSTVGVTPRQSNSPKPGGRLLMTLDTQDISTLDPVLPHDNSSIWTILNLYDQLFRVAKDGQSVEPDAVEGYVVSTNGLVYTFILRNGLTFSEGARVTVDDIVFSLERMLASENWGWLFPQDAAVVAVDHQTFQIKLTQPNAPLINNLAGFWSSIVPRQSVEVQGEAFWDKPVGSGPFRVKEWVRGSHITLERNPHYWGEAAYLDEVELQLVTDDNTRMLKFQAGELDVATNVPYSLIAGIDRLDGVSVQIATLLGVDLLALNASRPPMDDVNVRLALNHATDRHAIVEAILFGNGKEATVAWPKVLYWNDQLKGYPYDLEVARDYMRRSDAPDGFSVAYMYRGDSEPDAQIGVLLQAQWAKIGVTVQLEPLESAQIRERAFSSNFDVIKIFNSSDVIDPSELTANYLCRFTQPVIGICHDGIDQLYAETERMMDPAKRRAGYFRLMEMGNEWAVFVPLYYAPARTAIQDTVKGFQVLPTGNVRLWEVWLDR